MRPMPEIGGLSDLQERVLLAIWRLKGVGKSGAEEDKLRAEFSDEPEQNLQDAVEGLRGQKFVESTNTNSTPLLSLTPLGVAILRKIEEDRLQELK